MASWITDIDRTWEEYMSNLPLDDIIATSDPALETLPIRLNTTVPAPSGYWSAQQASNAVPQPRPFMPSIETWDQPYNVNLAGHDYWDVKRKVIELENQRLSELEQNTSARFESLGLRITYVTNLVGTIEKWVQEMRQWLINQAGKAQKRRQAAIAGSETRQCE
ncbi:MAG: hypothetical protein Q9165_008785 [Trypethelium subeluteriae]